MTSANLDLTQESERLFLAELLSSSNGIAGLTSAPPPYDKKPFDDGGKWRGLIARALFRAGIIRPVTRAEAHCAVAAKRPSRHGTILRLWKLLDRPAAERRLAELIARRRRPADPGLFDKFETT